MILDPTPKLDSEESNTLSSYFGILRGNKSNENGISSSFKELGRE